MNREDIIRMAREAGFLVDEFHLVILPKTNRHSFDAEIKRFANLVAAAQREKLAQWMIRRGYATGHGDTIEDLLYELEWQIDEKVEVEREACADIAENWNCNGFPRTGVAEAIRARGEK